MIKIERGDKDWLDIWATLSLDEPTIESDLKIPWLSDLMLV